MVLSIGVVENRFQVGLSALNDTASLMKIGDLDWLLNERFESDAHFVTYFVEGEESWPRLNKSVLAEIHKSGGKVMTQMLAIDYDNPKHAPWDEQLLDEFDHKCKKIAEEGFKRITEAAAFYTTKAGARFIFILTEPVEVTRGEHLHRGLVDEFRSSGLLVDENTSDWTRLFRAPRVIRDDKWTDESPYFFIDQQNVAISPSTIRESGTPKRTALGALTVDSAPSFDAANALLWTTGDSAAKLIRTDWYKRARKALKKKECFTSLFENAVIAEKGARNSTIFKYAGEAVRCLHDEPGTSPHLIFALFVPAIESLADDDAGKPWSETCWRAINFAWRQEEDKVLEKKAQVQTALTNREDIFKQVLGGMRQWCRHPDLEKDDANAVAFVTRHAIAARPDGKYHLLNQHGFYDRVPIKQHLVAARTRELGMQDVIFGTTEMTKAGLTIPPIQKVLLHHSTSVAALEGAAGTRGCTIRGLGSPDATLILSLYQRRDDIQPVYDQQVHEWLVRLGGIHFHRLQQWLGNALAFEEGPICALSITGPPSIGKKMLVAGLSENCTSQTTADVKELTGRFQSQLARTPFVICNEGFPHAEGAGMRDAADSFRHAVSGDPWPFEGKGEAVMTIYNPMRVMILANNLDVLRTLHQHRNLSPSDRDALAMRVFHIEADDTAKRYLQFLGGAHYTAQPGRRWIRGDSGEQSHYVVASHFRWLYENREPKRPGARFLVEGDPNDVMLATMGLNSGAAPDVIEVLLQMSEIDPAPDGLYWDDDHLLVTSAAIALFWRRLNRPGTLNTKVITSVMRGLVVSRQPPQPWVPHVGDKFLRKALWYLVDLDMLKSQAELHGWACEKLLKKIEHRDSLKAIR